MVGTALRGARARRIEGADRLRRATQRTASSQMAPLRTTAPSGDKARVAI